MGWWKLLCHVVDVFCCILLKLLSSSIWQSCYRLHMWCTTTRDAPRLFTPQHRGWQHGESHSPISVSWLFSNSSHLKSIPKQSSRLVYSSTITLSANFLSKIYQWAKCLRCHKSQSADTWKWGKNVGIFQMTRWPFFGGTSWHWWIILWRYALNPGTMFSVSQTWTQISCIHVLYT